MQGNRGRRDPFSDFGDPFAGFGGFGGFGGQRSLISDFLGGRDPFDDPFFTRPFGGMFEPSFFGSAGSPFPDMQPNGYLQHEVQDPRRQRGPIIEELSSDDEKEEASDEGRSNSRKHRRSGNEPHVEDPDDEGRGTRQLQYRNNQGIFRAMQSQPQNRSFTFQSSTITYGGADGAYRTSSKTRRTGSDGVTFEESREADSSTRQASHKVSRGLYNKGHTVSRKLKSDGRVDTMQTLHNLNEDELSGFEEAWKGKAGQHLPSWMGSHGQQDPRLAIGNGQSSHANQGGWALPSAQTMHGRQSQAGARDSAGSPRLDYGKQKHPSEVNDKPGSTRWRGRD